MPDQPFNRARFIRKKRRLKILEICAYLTFVVAAIFVYDKISATVFAVTMLLFGGGAVMTLRELVWPQSALGAQMLANHTRDLQTELGNFSYDDQGFTAIGQTGPYYCRWAEVEVLFAYNILIWEERYTDEQPILVIITADQNRHIIYTYAPGWPQYRLRLQQQFPGLPPNWLENMPLPIQKPNQVLLFDRQGRSQQQIEQIYFPQQF